MKVIRKLFGVGFPEREASVVKPGRGATGFYLYDAHPMVYGYRYWCEISSDDISKMARGEDVPDEYVARFVGAKAIMVPVDVRHGYGMSLGGGDGADPFVLSLLPAPQQPIRATELGLLRTMLSAVEQASTADNIRVESMDPGDGSDDGESARRLITKLRNAIERGPAGTFVGNASEFAAAHGYIVQHLPADDDGNEADVNLNTANLEDGDDEGLNIAAAILSSGNATFGDGDEAGL